MPALEVLLLVGSVVAILGWAALSVHVVRVQRQRVEARELIDVIVRTLQLDAVGKLPASTRIQHIRPFADQASREIGRAHV